MLLYDNPEVPVKLIDYRGGRGRFSRYITPLRSCQNPVISWAREGDLC
jgi:hypothetical protein